FVDFWRRQLLASDYRAGCPVLAVAVDDDPEFPELADLAARSFARWQEELVGILVHHAMAPGAADTLALHALSQLEGAAVPCRAWTPRPRPSPRSPPRPPPNATAPPRARPRRRVPPVPRAGPGAARARRSAGCGGPGARPRPRCGR